MSLCMQKGWQINKHFDLGPYGQSGRVTHQVFEAVASVALTNQQAIPKVLHLADPHAASACQDKDEMACNSEKPSQC